MIVLGVTQQASHKCYCYISLYFNHLMNKLDTIKENCNEKIKYLNVIYFLVKSICK